MTQTPPPEVDISEELIKSLIASQHPDLASLPLQFLDSGWDNVMYKLGTDYLVRLPRRKIAAQLLKNELDWLSDLAPHLPIPVSSAVRKGVPQGTYPWHWGILPWFEGKTAGNEVPDASEASGWAHFLKALHQPASQDAPRNELRGVPLQQRAEDTDTRMIRLKNSSHLITPRIENIWKEALEVPASRTDCWIHGDLHPRNIVVNQGKITAVIDWGDMTSGDAATDLASVWMLFDTFDSIDDFMEIYQPDEALLQRAKGWAIFFGTVLLENGMTGHEEHASIGKRTLENLHRNG